MQTYQGKKLPYHSNLMVTVPGSKSITNRALLLAALAEGRSILDGVLFSDDSNVFLQALRDLGFTVEVDEKALRVALQGMGGRREDELLQPSCLQREVYVPGNERYQRKNPEQQ